MRKLFTIVLAVLLPASVFLPQQASAQSPGKMSYQAVIRDASDHLITDTQVGMQISILQDSKSGTAVYVETQKPTTNVNGLVSIEIGTGIVESGDFTTIDWSNGPYFIKTETDPAGNTNYTITGTSQLLSVPYALHAKTAETVSGGITETDPVYSGSEAANITVADITNLGNLSGTNTGDQDISGIAINTQAIQDTASQIRGDLSTVATSGDYNALINTPDLSNFDQDVTDDFDGDYNNLTNTPDLSNYLTTEVDGDPTNEIQNLQLVGNILTITNNGTATDIDLSAYLDNTDTQLTDAEIAALGFIKSADDADADATNEIQDLQLVGNILTITNNGTATDIDLSAYLDNTDTQLSDAEIATMGYIKNADETDPIFTAWDKDYEDLTNVPTTITTAQADAIDDNTAKNSYPAVDATKLAGIDEGAEVNVNADWDATSGDAQILNKPTIPAEADGSETKVEAGTNVTVTGTGTTASPYVVNASGGGERYLGEEYLDGIIFYLYIGSDGQQHGLVVSKTESTGTWSGSSTLVGADRTEDGAYNTNLMPAGSTAKTWVTGLGAGWYLPSIDELSLLWHNRYHVNKTARAISSTLLSTSAGYWCSTEYNASGAFTFAFYNGYTYNLGKTSTCSVRAVRAF